jgi:hypothetical protein
MKLLSSQKDTVYDMIQLVGFHPAQFEIVESDSEMCYGQKKTTLYFRETEFYFCFENGPNSISRHYAVMVPGRVAFMERSYPGEWDGQLRIFNKWLHYLIREINANNKWNHIYEELAKIKNLLNENENIMGGFSPEQIFEITECAESVKGAVSYSDFTKNEREIISQKMNTLMIYARSMSKDEWRMFFLGVIVSIVSEIDPIKEERRQLWSLFKKMFDRKIFDDLY